MGRDYDNSSRALRAARTAARIVTAAEELLRERPIAEATLSEVADLAGVSVQTVIRKFGGWDGVFAAVSEQVGARIESQRNDVTPGDLGGAVANVVEHYEAEGDLILHLLSQETTSELAREAASQGRAFHRRWVEVTFAPQLSRTAPDYERRVDALVAATDLFTWRLLRRDLGRSVDEVENVMLRLVRAGIGEPV